jgi:hypothetical protein
MSSKRAMTIREYIRDKKAISVSLLMKMLPEETLNLPMRVDLKEQRNRKALASENGRVDLEDPNRLKGAVTYSAEEESRILEQLNSRL